MMKNSYWKFIVLPSCKTDFSVNHYVPQPCLCKNWKLSERQYEKQKVYEKEMWNRMSQARPDNLMGTSFCLIIKLN